MQTPAVVTLSLLRNLKLPHLKTPKEVAEHVVISVMYQARRLHALRVKDATRDVTTGIFQVSVHKEEMFEYMHDVKYHKVIQAAIRAGFSKKEIALDFSWWDEWPPSMDDVPKCLTVCFHFAPPLPVVVEAKYGLKQD